MEGSTEEEDQTEGTFPLFSSETGNRLSPLGVDDDHTDGEGIPAEKEACMTTNGAGTPTPKPARFNSSAQGHKLQYKY